jgi:hypothetical protein
MFSGFSREGDVPFLIRLSVDILRYRVIDEKIGHVKSVKYTLAIFFFGTRIARHEHFSIGNASIAVFCGNPLEANFCVANNPDKNE